MHEKMKSEKFNQIWGRCFVPAAGKKGGKKPYRWKKFTILEISESLLYPTISLWLVIILQF